MNSLKTQTCVVEAVSAAGVAVVRLKGEIDLSTCPPLRVTLKALLASGNRIILDLSEVAYLDSAALQVLAETARSLRDCARKNGGRSGGSGGSGGGVLHVVQPAPYIERILWIVGLRNVMKIHASLEAALADAERTMAQTPTRQAHAAHNW